MILVVDDHADTRSALVQILTLEGYSSYAVASAREALVVVQRYRPVLVILDYNMPDMDGLALFAEMRKDSRLADLPAILFTAHYGIELEDKAQAAGIASIITKGSLDWMKLYHEIARLAGPPSASSTLPQIPNPSDREIC